MLETPCTSGLLCNQVLNHLDVVHLEAFLVAAHGDVYKQVLGCLKVVVVKQRGLQGALYGVFKTILSGAFAATHQGHAAVLHHIADILEVHVLVASGGDDLCDALHCRCKYLICKRIGILNK